MKNLKYYRVKCDKRMQEIGREIHDKCLVCGQPMSCHHHFYPKSMSSALRYDWENLIPLCAYCHFSHHNGNPDIHAKVIKIKGEKWLDSLQVKRTLLVKPSIKYYKDILEKLEII